METLQEFSSGKNQDIKKERQALKDLSLLSFETGLESAPQ